MNARTRIGRRLGLSGALLLAVTFFLPAFHGCSEDRTPAVEVYRTVVHPEAAWETGASEQGNFIYRRQSPLPHLKSLGVFLLPWATGVLYPLRLWLLARGRERTAHVWLFGWLMATFVALELGFVTESLKYFRRDGLEAIWRAEFYAAVGPLPLLAGFVYLRQRVRDHARAALLCQCSLAIALVLFFTGYTIWMTRSMNFDPRYGLILAITAAVLQAVGAVLEWLGRTPPAIG